MNQQNIILVQQQQHDIKQSNKFNRLLGFDPSYLCPPEKLYKQIIHDEHYCYSGFGKHAKRKIYHNVQYTQFEQKGLQVLQSEVEKMKPAIQFPQQWGQSDMLKMCYNGRFELKKCCQSMQTYINWLNNEQAHIVDAQIHSLLNNGFIQLIGRDFKLRPVILLNCEKIPITNKDKKEEIVKACSIFFGMIAKYMLVDYHIENWILLIETNQIGVFNLPRQTLSAIIQCMSIYFCAKLEKLFILNPSWGLKAIWQIISTFMDPETNEKINMISMKNINTLKQYIPEESLLVQYGGKLSPISDNYWPPRDIFTAQNQQLLQQLRNQPGQGTEHNSNQNQEIINEVKYNNVILNTEEQENFPKEEDEQAIIQQIKISIYNSLSQPEIVKPNIDQVIQKNILEEQKFVQNIELQQPLQQQNPMPTIQQEKQQNPIPTIQEEKQQTKPLVVTSQQIVTQVPTKDVNQVPKQQPTQVNQEQQNGIQQIKEPETQMVQKKTASSKTQCRCMIF